MTRLLLHHSSWDRLQPLLRGLPGSIVPVVAQDDGRLLLDGQEITPEDAAPEIVWANADAFGSAALRPLFVAALKSPALKWMQSGAAGLDSPVFASVVRKGATLTTQHVQAVGIAEYVLWGVLDHFQRGAERRAAQAAARWDRFPFREVAGSTWLIVGFGAIGQAIAERARSFGARTIGVRRRGGTHPLADEMASDWRSPLPRADVVVLCLPYSTAVARMADASAFAAMKPDAVFINVGRGGLVDETALLAALDAGRPEHAVLDVFDAEPLPADSPFWSHPRVTVTPHSSGISSGLTERSDRIFIDNLRRYLAGEPLDEVVSAEEVIAASA